MYMYAVSFSKIWNIKHFFHAFFKFVRDYICTLFKNLKLGLNF